MRLSVMLMRAGMRVPGFVDDLQVQLRVRLT
jgi:hypothetical protein